MSLNSSSDDDNDENCLDQNNTEILTIQKSLIYKHPLFPVLTHVLEQCEQETRNPSLLTIKDDCQTPPLSLSSFENNLKIFLSKNNDILTITRDINDSSSMIDQLYIDAMQVLRIHLLELEKLNELCEDFCQRYIACLKVKLNPNNIFSDDEEDGNDDNECEDFESNNDEDFESIEENDDDNFMFNQQQFNNKHLLKVQSYNKQTVPTNDINSIYNQHTTQFNGQTPFSQIIASGSSSIVNSSSSSISFDSTCTKQRKSSTIVSSSKRSILPKSATSIMRSWLFQHIAHPYPSEDEKRAISNKTNLSLLQVNNWFINARRRILQPMLETSNPNLIINKKKKRCDTILDDNHHQHRHSRQMSYINRYWPSNLIQFDMNKK
ncbi:unnamed protein product [Rotaria sp. Silwood1]|nr:unnamed protein product [Rotaria sp. Silwood1]